MPRIEPVPWEYLSGEQRHEIEDSRAIGLQPKQGLTSQVMAYSSAAFRAMKLSSRALFRNGVIEPRLQELLRLRSANLSQCKPYAAARKEVAVTDEDVACLIDPSLQGLSKRERMAISFFDQLASDHWSVNDKTFLELAEVFSTAEIVEPGWRCETLIGVHRFLRCLDVLGEEPRVLPFAPSEIDRSTANDRQEDAAAIRAAQAR